MRGLQQPFVVGVIGLSLLAQAQRPGGEISGPGPGPGRGPAGGGPPEQIETTSTSTLSLTSSPTPTSTSASQEPTTTAAVSISTSSGTQERSVSSTSLVIPTSIVQPSFQSTNLDSIFTRSTSARSTPPAETTSIGNGPVERTPTESTTIGSTPIESDVFSPSSSPNSDSSYLSSSHRQLVIILSSLLGSIGLLLASLVLFLVCRHRKRKTFRRGVSPIDDEEIESWRNKERKESSGSGHQGYVAGDNSIGLAFSASSPIQSPRAAKLNRSASFQAPNARIGLTDEVVPGDAAFVPTVKRQSPRLSKAPPGHIRTKSSRSSSSMRSVHGVNTRSFLDDSEIDGRQTWCDSEYRAGSRVFLPTVTTSSPVTSIYDGLNEQGGLSPRPKPKAREPFNGIGMAFS